MYIHLQGSTSVCDSGGPAELRPNPEEGHLYQIKRGDNLLHIASRAYGVGAGQERLRLARLINNDPFNLRLRRPEPVNLFPEGIISFYNEFADSAKQLHAKGKPPSGKEYAVIKIPCRNGTKHIVVDEPLIVTGDKPKPPRPRKPKHIVVDEPLIVTGDKPKPRREVPKPVALSRNEIRLFVWSLIGERPHQMTVGQLAREFNEFVDLQSLLKKPTLLNAIKEFGKTFTKVLRAEFEAEPERQFGFLVGQSYALVDAATKQRSSRRVKEGQTTAQRRFSEGFNEGYNDMRRHIRSLASHSDGVLLLERLAAVRPTVALSGIYRALFEVLKPKLRQMKSQQYFAARENCSFRYPNFGVVNCRIN
jgi:hypothetical protein